MVSVVVDILICMCATPMMFYWISRSWSLLRSHPRALDQILNADERRLRMMWAAVH